MIGTPERAIGERAVRILHGNDPKGVGRVLIPQRHVLARHERMRAEAVAGFVIVGAVLVVVENPPGAFASARLVGKPAGLVVLALPETPDAAAIAQFLERRGIDMATPIERCHEFVTARGRSVRMLLRAREIQSDALEHMG
jgi:hypothetical protein